MADAADATTEVHWIAIDVARYWNAVLIETASGQRHRFKMANSAPDFVRLLDLLKSFGGRFRAGLNLLAIIIVQSPTALFKRESRW